jgi:hypothetical protein
LLCSSGYFYSSTTKTCKKVSDSDDGNSELILVLLKSYILLMFLVL